MFCKNCGAEIPGGSGFCSKCGKPVEAMVAVEKEKEEIAVQTSEKSAPQSEPKSKPKPKGLVAPIATLLAAVSGWIYILYTNSIQGMMAWFTSSDELKNSVSQNYNYYGNNFSVEELAGNIVLIAVMVLFTLLGIVGIVMLIKRLIRKFMPGKRG